MARLARRPLADHKQIAADLRANPGQWRDVQTYRTRYSAVGVADTIRKGDGKFNAYEPAGAFEADIKMLDEGTLVRARYVGGGAR
ncbi:hypothetical protein [Streptomyces wuyuanensis]|uniref:hypothetical protein n=1 Tax=Streptomyces wuyuanensis TaxID=1196353 RepID=UPI0037A6450D